MQSSLQLDLLISGLASSTHTVAIKATNIDGFECITYYITVNI